MSEQSVTTLAQHTGTPAQFLRTVLERLERGEELGVALVTTEEDPADSVLVVTTATIMNHRYTLLGGVTLLQNRLAQVIAEEG